MKPFAIAALPMLAFMTVAGAQAPATAPVARMSAPECEVWARELSFAQSVARHDAAAFATHLESDAAFGASRPEPTRARDNIAKRWSGIIEGKRLRLEWYPTRTTIAASADGGVGDIAWSSGPSLFEDLDPKSPQRYRIGAFHSVWHRGADGVWRVLFDDGVDPKPVSEADAVAFRAGRKAQCPQA
ncbi:YybH family protein [Lysobacter panacisoli]|nr:DUF4440 domain-containing protein [Lysobacter panacisoli]